MRRTILIAVAVVIVLFFIYLLINIFGGDGPILVLKPRPRPNSPAPGNGEPAELTAREYDWTVSNAPAGKSGTIFDGGICYLRADLIKPTVQTFRCDNDDVARIELVDDDALSRVVVNLTATDKLDWDVHSRTSTNDAWDSACPVLSTLPPIKFNHHKLPDELLDRVNPGYVRCYDADDNLVTDSPDLVCIRLGNGPCT